MARLCTDETSFGVAPKGTSSSAWDHVEIDAVQLIDLPADQARATTSDVVNRTIASAPDGLAHTIDAAAHARVGSGRACR